MMRATLQTYALQQSALVNSNPLVATHVRSDASQEEPAATLGDVAADMDLAEPGRGGRKRKERPVEDPTDTNAEPAHSQPSRRPYHRTAPTPSELKARVEELEQKLREADTDHHQARKATAQLEHGLEQAQTETDDARLQTEKARREAAQAKDSLEEAQRRSAHFQKKAADLGATVVTVREQVAKLETKAEALKLAAEESTELKDAAEKKVRKLQKKVRRLSGFHSARDQDVVFEKLKNKYAGKRSTSEIEKRNTKRKDLPNDVAAKEEALARDTRSLADLRAHLDFLNGPQAEQDRRDTAEHKRRDKAKDDRQEVRARAARALEAMRREEARALLAEDEAIEDDDDSAAASEDDNDAAPEDDDFVAPEDDNGEVADEEQDE